MKFIPFLLALSLFFACAHPSLFKRQKDEITLCCAGCSEEKWISTTESHCGNGNSIQIRQESKQSFYRSTEHNYNPNSKTLDSEIIQRPYTEECRTYLCTQNPHSIGE